MKKKMMALALCLLVGLTGCDRMVPEEEYQEAVETRDQYKEQYVNMRHEITAMEEKIEDLEKEYLDLEAQISAAEVELENATEAAELAVEQALVEQTEAQREEGTVGVTEDEFVLEVTDTVCVVYQLPEGFYEVADGQYCAPDSPYDTSNIIVTALEDDPYGINYTKENFEELMIAAYENQGFYVEKFEISEFEEGQLGGYDSLVICCSYGLLGLNVQQTQFMLQVDNVTCVFTYTTSDEYGWIDTFRENIELIRVTE